MPDHSTAERNRRRALRFHPVTLLLGTILLAHTALAQERIPRDGWMRYATPEDAGWSSAGIAGANALAESIGTAAFMLVYDGAVVATYGDVSRRYMCHSVRKSLLSALYGIYVDEGRIDVRRSLADLGIDDQGPISEAEKQATVIDLLTARSGVYHPAAYETPAMARSRPARGSHPPGAFWYYNNWDFNALGAIFRQETGEDLFQAFADRIARPLRMQDFRVRDGYYHREREHSAHPAYPFRMSARDMARFGLLFLREGRWGGERIIPASWIRESTRSYSEVDRPGLAGYGYMWWIVGGDLQRYGAYTATGVGTQTITVVPDLDLVFVHRVDTYAGERVGLEAILALLERLIDARMDEPAAAPRLVPLADPPAPARTVDVPEEILRRYARSYEYPSGRTVEVTLRDGELLLHDSLAGTFALLPLSETEFLIEDALEPAFFSAEGDSVAFVQERMLNGEGHYLLRRGHMKEAIDHLRRNVAFYPSSANAHQVLGRALLAAGDTAGAVRSYKRALELDPDNLEAEWTLLRIGADGFAEVVVPPDVLADYVGDYRFGQAVVTVSLAEGRLSITPPGAPSPVPLTATSRTTFLHPIPGGHFKLEFGRDATGAVSEVVVSDGRSASRGERIR